MTLFLNLFNIVWEFKTAVKASHRWYETVCICESLYIFFPGPHPFDLLESIHFHMLVTRHGV
jgi:hypothetical protein